MKTYKGKKDTILKRLIVSYLGILSIFLVFWVMIYGVMQYKIGKQTDSINAAILKSFQNEIDKRIVAVNTTGISVVLDSNIQYLISSVNKLTWEENSYNIYQARLRLEAYRKANNYISDIYIYFKDMDYIVSSNTAVKSKLYYQMNQAYLEDSYTEWLDKISTDLTGDYWNYKNINGKEQIFMGYSLPAKKKSDNNNSKATLVILLNEGTFSKVANEYCAINGISVGVCIKDSHFTYSTKAENEAVYKVIRSSSEVDGVQYIIKISKGIYMQQQQFLFFFLVISLCVFVLIFIFLTVKSIQKYYNPLRDLVAHIRMTVKDNDAANLSEYVYLQQAFQDVMEQEKCSETLIRQQMENLKRSYLVQLLTGSLETSDVDKTESSKFLRDFLYSKFMLILMNRNCEEEDLLEIEHLGICETKTEGMLEGIGLKVGRMTVLLINCESEQEESLFEKVNELREKITHLYDGYNMAVSSIHEIQQGIHKVYYEILYILQCMDTFGKKNEITREDTFERREFCWCSKEDETHLINAISCFDSKRVKEILNLMWQRVTGSDGTTIEEAKVLLIGQINILYKTVYELLPNGLQNGFPIRYYDILQMNRMDDIREVLFDSVDGILERMKVQMNHSETDQLVDEIIHYIDKNYHDVNLNVEVLCEQIGQPSVSMSKMFRENKGMSILNYINQKRIEAAKEAMRNTNGTIKINELYSKVGFGSINTFIRVFKKYEGVTPGNYAENHF